jgi:hypothetical protein
MAEILLVNPRKRRRKKARRMSALQRKYFGRKRGRKRARRSSAVAAAPVRRRRRKRATARRTRVYSNPRRSRRSRRSITRVRRYRRNPSLRGVVGSFMPMAKAGFIGATGAIGLDLLWAYGSKLIPDQIAGSALAQYAAKLMGAILIGAVGNKLPFLRGRGRDLAVGAATVVLHDAMKAQIQASFPDVKLGEYLTFAPTVGVMPRAGQLLSTGLAGGGVGEYLSGIPSQLNDGSYSPEWNGDGMNGY